VRSENAAHRFAVIRTDDPAGGSGVFIPRRDSSSRLATWVGGRLFPGRHQRASFRVRSDGENVAVAFRSRDGAVSVDVSGAVGSALPAESVFESVEASSRFFAGGSRGWSATDDPTRFDGLELRTNQWDVRPFDVTRSRSSFFADPTIFPAGSVRFDHALIMRRVAHTWHPLAPLVAEPELLVPAATAASIER
jgi:hypothetical protein